VSNHLLGLCIVCLPLLLQLFQLLLPHLQDTLQILYLRLRLLNLGRQLLITLRQLTTERLDLLVLLINTLLPHIDLVPSVHNVLVGVVENLHFVLVFLAKAGVLLAKGVEFGLSGFKDVRGFAVACDFVL
jgi:hypothetical protein